MAHAVGDSIVTYLSHIVNGTPVTGASFTVVTALRPDGTSFSPTITEVGGGTYRIAFSPNSVGQWYLLIVDTAQTPDVYYEETWDVDPGLPSTTTATSTASGITRRELRRSIGRTIGDLLLVTATGAGNVNTITDVLHLGTPDNSTLGRIGLVTGGTASNLGRQVRVTANSHTTATATFVPDLPQPTAIGDEIEFYNEKETATGPTTINDAINDAIRDVRVGYRIPAESDEFTWTYENTDGVEIPDEWDGVFGAVTQDWSGRWNSIPISDITVDTFGRRIFFANRSRWLSDNMSVKLVGTTVPPLLTEDTHTTNIDAEYLRLAVSAFILQSTAYRRMNSIEARQDAQTFQGRAASIRPKARRRAPANWIRL